MKIAVIVSGVAVDVVTDTEDIVLLFAATLLVHLENVFIPVAVASRPMIVPVGTVSVCGPVVAYVNTSVPIVAVTYPPVPTSIVSVLADEFCMNAAVIVSGVAVDVVTDTEDTVLLSAATLLVHVENAYPESAIAVRVMLVPVGTVITYAIAEALYVNTFPPIVAMTCPPVPTLSVSVLTDEFCMNAAVIVSGVAVDVVTDTEGNMLLFAATLLAHAENEYPESAIAASVILVPVGIVIVYGIAEALYVNTSVPMVAVTYPPVPTLSVSVLTDEFCTNTAVIVSGVAVDVVTDAEDTVLLFAATLLVHLENVFGPVAVASRPMTVPVGTVIVYGITEE